MLLLLQLWCLMPESAPGDGAERRGPCGRTPGDARQRVVGAIGGHFPVWRAGRVRADPGPQVAWSPGLAPTFGASHCGTRVWLRALREAGGTRRAGGDAGQDAAGALASWGSPWEPPLDAARFLGLGHPGRPWGWGQKSEKQARPLAS